MPTVLVGSGRDRLGERVAVVETYLAIEEPGFAPGGGQEEGDARCIRVSGAEK